LQTGKFILAARKNTRARAAKRELARAGQKKSKTKCVVSSAKGTRPKQK